jgi:AraC family transcriptional regulator
MEHMKLRRPIDAGPDAKNNRAGSEFLKASVLRGTQLSARLQTDPAGVVEVSARTSPGIVIHVGRPVHIACERAGRRHQGLSVHGDIDIIPGGVPSRWEARESDTALILGVSSGLLRHLACESGLDPDRIEIVNRFQIRDLRLEYIGWAVKAEMESGRQNGSLYLEGLARAIAAHLLNHYSSESQAPPEAKGVLSRYRLKKVLAYVDDHISNKLSIAELAAVAGLGVSHFSTSFRASVGQSVHQYVTRRRVDRAQSLLRQRTQPISQVAIETGFAHASHLAYHMRRLLGTSPRNLATRF